MLFIFVFKSLNIDSDKKYSLFLSIGIRTSINLFKFYPLGQVFKNSFLFQVLGKVPTISIDKTDGCQMYLNNDTLNVELITSKSSEMNVLIPTTNNDYVSLFSN